MPQPITQRQQQQDEGDPPAGTPSVGVQMQTVTSVATSTSTITVQPSPALNQGSNNPGNNEPPPGQKKTGLQPPPAWMQWVQSVLVDVAWAWALMSQVCGSVWGSWWIGRLRGRNATAKPSDEKPDESQDNKSPDDGPGKSNEVASTTVSAEVSRGGRWKFRFGQVDSFVHKLMQFKLPPVGQGPPGPCN
jgi:hypothetical protein